jgi:hypothetical protein
MIEAEPRLTLLVDHYASAVERDGATLKAVTLTPTRDGPAQRVTAKVFVDGTYEGDLAALARVPYRVGREARSEYDEPHAGRIFVRNRFGGAWPDEARDGRLNVLPYHHTTVEVLAKPSTGAGDRAVQAYNLRTILTREPANRVMLTEPPAGYDREAMSRLEYSSKVPLPNGKISWNRPQLVGPHHAWPDGDRATRERIFRQHREATLGLLWYLQNDPAVPANLRKQWEGYGLAKDEFPDNDHMPYDIYVREARRLTGRATFTQHDAMLAAGLGRTPIHADSIGITDYPMDAHACHDERVDGSQHEGKLLLAIETRPGQVPYRCLLPQGVDNLLVPVCLSASHVGWGTVRMEPVWMHVGESAGCAAALSVRTGQTPAALAPDQLLRRLADTGVMLAFLNDAAPGGSEPWSAAVQYLANRGYFPTFDAKPKALLQPKTAAAWAKAFRERPEPATLARELMPLVGEKGPGLTARAFAALVPGAVEQVTALKIDADAALTRGDACRLLYALSGDHKTSSTSLPIPE